MLNSDPRKFARMRVCGPSKMHRALSLVVIDPLRARARPPLLSPGITRSKLEDWSRPPHSAISLWRYSRRGCGSAAALTSASSQG